MSKPLIYQHYPLFKMKLCLALGALAALSSASSNVGMAGQTTFSTVITPSSSTNTTLIEPVTTMTLTINSTMSGELTVYNNGFPSSTTTVHCPGSSSSSRPLYYNSPQYCFHAPLASQSNCHEDSSFIFDSPIYSSFILNCLIYPFKIDPHSSHNHDSDYEALQNHFDSSVYPFQINSFFKASHLVYQFQNGSFFFEANHFDQLLY
ncbi:hypothetical protein KCU65_g9559, partial [Aureobasidium melanogenum]